MLLPVVLAGTAAAAGASVTATVVPATAGSASGLSVSVSGGLPSGIPSTLELTAQPGFASSGTKAVTALCTGPEASTDSCPAASVVGSGSVGTSFHIIHITLNLTLAVGAPSQPGDLATVYLIGKLGNSNVSLPGRLFRPSGGGLELLVAVSGLPSLPGLSVTSLSLQAKHSRTVTTYTTKKVTTGTGTHKKTTTVKVPHKTVYSVLTNPRSCPSSAAWTGSFTATYSGKPTALPFTVACTASRTGATGATGATGKATTATRSDFDTSLVER